jgi:ceramide glucosyltransferase
LAGGMWPIAAAIFAASQAELSLASVLALATVWYGCEAVLAWAAGWHLNIRAPLAWVIRDLLLPVIWFNGWLDSAFVWRGNEMRPVESSGTV